MLRAQPVEGIGKRPKEEDNLPPLRNGNPVVFQACNLVICSEPR